MAAVEYDANGAVVNQRRASGMLREWTFSYYAVHEAARAQIQFVPQWEATFIDPDEIPDLSRLDRDVEACPLIPFFAFRDITAADKSLEGWEEIAKHARFEFAHLEKRATLKQFCIQCARHVLSNKHLAELDGETNFRTLTVGKKISSCKRKLNGHESFHFKYRVEDKTNLINDYYYGIGTIVGRRGYFITVRCAREAELDAYVSKKLLPHLHEPKNFKLDANVVYSETSYQLLKEQQQLFGELQFFDEPAAVSFAIPMHSLFVRPDYSPTQTVDVGSLSCMTLELSVFQKLVDDYVEGDGTGMPKHKANSVYLFLDVENVAKNGYPSIMSVEEYSHLKTKRLLKTFPDAKPVGTPTSLSLGGRCGRATTATFLYDGEGALGGHVVKSMMVSTLIGNHGVTALYFTKLGQGLFDAHLYLFQQLLKNVNFFSERELVEDFSRFKSVNIRLTDQDMARAYNNAPAGEQQALEAHIKALQASNDGKCEGARIITPDEKDGGLVRHVPPLPSSVAAQQTDSGKTTPVNPPVVEDDGIENKPGQEDADPTVIPIDNIPHLNEEHAWDAVDLNTKEAQEIEASQKQGGDGAATTEDGGDGVSGSPSGGAGSPHNDTDRDFNITSNTEMEGGGDRGTSPDTTSAASPVEGDADGTATSGDAAGTSRPTTADQKGSPSRGGSAKKQPTGEYNEEELKQKVTEALHSGDDDVYFGPSLRDVYTHCCNDVKCKPNSYLLSKLPDNPRFTASILELDMSTNYLGTNGFVALLMFIGHLPKVQRLFFNDMTLNNEDVKHMCEMLAENETVTSIHLRNNTKINIAATQHLTRLVRKNKRITSLSLSGTSLGAKLIARIEADAEANAVVEEEVAGGNTNNIAENVEAPATHDEQQPPTTGEGAPTPQEQAPSPPVTSA